MEDGISLWSTWKDNQVEFKFFNVQKGLSLRQQLLEKLINWMQRRRARPYSQSAWVFVQLWPNTSVTAYLAQWVTFQATSSRQWVYALPRIVRLLLNFLKFLNTSQSHKNKNCTPKLMTAVLFLYIKSMLAQLLAHSFFALYCSLLFFAFTLQLLTDHSTRRNV